MGALRRQLQRKSHSSPEWRKVLQLLARNPRGVTDDVLELAHGFSRETLLTLTLAGFATVVTETLRVRFKT